jgi:hypothetical protein
MAILFNVDGFPLIFDIAKSTKLAKQAHKRHKIKR